MLSDDRQGEHFRSQPSPPPWTLPHCWLSSSMAPPCPPADCAPWWSAARTLSGAYLGQELQKPCSGESRQNDGE
jgi:hypothetical protein